jgi:hypothetical protein
MKFSAEFGVTFHGRLTNLTGRGYNNVGIAVPQDKKFRVFVCVYGIVMSTVQWCVSTELWYLDSSDVSTE